MTPEDEIAKLLKDAGAVLDRTANHNVWKLPDGRIFVQAKTPSDSHTSRNSLTDLRKLLGLKREVHKNPGRKRKTGTPAPMFYGEHIPARRDWKDALREMAEFHPPSTCLPVDIRPVPMTPLWAILRNLLGYGG